MHRWLTFKKAECRSVRKDQLRSDLKLRGSPLVAVLNQHRLQPLSHADDLAVFFEPNLVH
jgi:hypothetical protein